MPPHALEGAAVVVRELESELAAERRTRESLEARIAELEARLLGVRATPEEQAPAAQVDLGFASLQTTLADRAQQEEDLAPLHLWIQEAELRLEAESGAGNWSQEPELIQTLVDAPARGAGLSAARVAIEAAEARAAHNATQVGRLTEELAAARAEQMRTMARLRELEARLRYAEERAATPAASSLYIPPPPQAWTETSAPSEATPSARDLADTLAKLRREDSHFVPEEWEEQESAPAAQKAPAESEMDPAEPQAVPGPIQEAPEDEPELLEAGLAPLEEAPIPEDTVESLEDALANWGGAEAASTLAGDDELADALANWGQAEAPGEEEQVLEAVLEDWGAAFEEAPAPDAETPLSDEDEELANVLEAWGSSDEAFEAAASAALQEGEQGPDEALDAWTATPEDTTAQHPASSELTEALAAADTEQLRAEESHWEETAASFVADVIEETIYTEEAPAVGDLLTHRHEQDEDAEIPSEADAEADTAPAVAAEFEADALEISDEEGSPGTDLSAGMGEETVDEVTEEEPLFAPESDESDHAAMPEPAAEPMLDEVTEEEPLFTPESDKSEDAATPEPAAEPVLDEVTEEEPLIELESAPGEPALEAAEGAVVQVNADVTVQELLDQAATEQVSLIEAADALVPGEISDTEDAAEDLEADAALFAAVEQFSASLADALTPDADDGEDLASASPVDFTEPGDEPEGGQESEPDVALGGEREYEATPETIVDEPHPEAPEEPQPDEEEPDLGLDKPGADENEDAVPALSPVDEPEAVAASEQNANRTAAGSLDLAPDSSEAATEEQTPQVEEVTWQDAEIVEAPSYSDSAPEHADQAVESQVEEVTWQDSEFAGTESDFEPEALPAGAVENEADAGAAPPETAIPSRSAGRAERARDARAGRTTARREGAPRDMRDALRAWGGMREDAPASSISASRAPEPVEEVAAEEPPLSAPERKTAPTEGKKNMMDALMKFMGER